MELDPLISRFTLESIKARADAPANVDALESKAAQVGATGGFVANVANALTSRLAILVLATVGLACGGTAIGLTVSMLVGQEDVAVVPPPPPPLLPSLLIDATLGTTIEAFRDAEYSYNLARGLSVDVTSVSTVSSAGSVLASTTIVYNESSRASQDFDYINSLSVLDFGIIVGQSVIGFNASVANFVYNVTCSGGVTNACSLAHTCGSGGRNDPCKSVGFCGAPIPSMKITKCSLV